MGRRNAIAALATVTVSTLEAIGALAITAPFGAAHAVAIAPRVALAVTPFAAVTPLEPLGAIAIATPSPPRSEARPNCGSRLRTANLCPQVRYELVKVKQQKYVCRCCVETALGPDRAPPGSRYSLALALKILLDKWLDHIPLERQARIMERHGLVITS